jgi:hypothetical protein
MKERARKTPLNHREEENANNSLSQIFVYASPGRLLLQLTIFTLSAVTEVWLSNLKVTSLIRKVQTSSQNRYVSRWP